MPETAARAAFRRRLLGAVEGDPRIVGLVDYGSSSEGRLDEWSDLDVALWLHDADYSGFRAAWRDWVAQLGPLLLAYVGGVGHPWTVYDAAPLPLRVDFNFWRASEVDAVLAWPNSPVSVAAMVWYDATGGKLSATVAQLVGRSLQPTDVAATFSRVCGDFWYYLLFAESKRNRGEGWLARQVFHGEVMQNLLALLRLEAGAQTRWQASSPAAGVERSLAPERLRRLDACEPAAGNAELRRVLAEAARLGGDVCAHIAEQRSWDWPAALAERVVAVLGDVE